MEDIAPDLALAIELIEERDVLWWGQLADGLIQPTPRISQRGMDGLEEFQAWAASRVGSPRSLVVAAVANVSRVVADLSGVFSYEPEFNDGYLIAHQWYRNFVGAPRYREVADYEMHVRLIHNLAIELIRAVNLVIGRAKRAEPALLSGQPLAVIVVGPDHMPVQAVEYSKEAGAAPQPYPGLRAFPAAIPSRDPGGFGHHGDDTPRTQEEFERWVGVVEKAIGYGSPPPPEDEPPPRLSAPASAAEEDQVPRSLKAAWSAFALIAAILTLLNSPWALGAAAGFALVTARFHRRIWKWPPHVGPILLAFAVAVALGISAQLASDEFAGDGNDQSSAVGSKALSEDERPSDSPGVPFQDEVEGSEPGPSGRVEAAAGEMSTSAEYNLSAGLRIANRTLGDRWATEVRADPTDRLAFALTVENRSPAESYPLVAWTQHENDPEVDYGHQVRLLIAKPSGEVLLEAPWVHTRAWSNQFGPFYVVTRERAGMGVVRSPSGDVLRTLRNESGTSPYRFPDELWGASELGLGLDSLSIGRLESGERVLVEFVGSWDISNDYEGFGSIDPTFEVNGSSAPEPLDIGSVRVRDRLTFYILLDNQGNHSSPSRVRVDFRPRRGGRYIEMRTFGIQYDRERLIGTTTINSGDGRPISLRPVSNSTQLLSHPLGSWVYHPDCPLEEVPTDSRRLEEGIALGGVDIGEFGGFTAHGSCAGVEFNKQLRFEAVVRPG
ncbi:MAG TPA: hypothetical protein VF081_13505 [Solirubrobacterales bacterium]